MKNILLYGALFFTITSCVTNVPLHSGFFKSQSRTGFILMCKMESTGSSSSGGGGLAGALVSSALQPKTKYDIALQTLQPVLVPNERIKQLYMETFLSKGKILHFIEDPTFNPNDLDYFNGDKDSTKKYFKKEIRFLREKYQIDELLLVFVQYGMYAKYSYGIETARYGKMYIKANIINLSDNSLLYKDGTSVLIPIKGEWRTPPEYENMRNGISKAIEQAIAKEKLKYQ
jgi:hypothetical protein